MSVMTSPSLQLGLSFQSITPRLQGVGWGECSRSEHTGGAFSGAHEAVQPGTLHGPCCLPARRVPWHKFSIESV